MDRIVIARVAHQINKAYCEAMGDDSQVSWDDAPEWQKDSALVGVDSHLANPEAGPEASHESWLAQKEADGWVYGEVKDAEAKTHPCMVPFAELSKEQQAKDYLFRAVVHALIAINADAAPVINQFPVAVGTVPVRYVLNRENHVDTNYGTGAWAIGETKAIPRGVATKMLKHADVYEISDDAVTSEVIEKEDELPDNSKAQETYDMINAMEKDALKTFIKTQFNRDIDMRKHKEVATLRALATQLTDQYGTLA